MGDEYGQRQNKPRRQVTMMLSSTIFFHFQNCSFVIQGWVRVVGFMLCISAFCCDLNLFSFDTCRYSQMNVASEVLQNNTELV